MSENTEYDQFNQIIYEKLNKVLGKDTAEEYKRATEYRGIKFFPNIRTHDPDNECEVLEAAIDGFDWETAPQGSTYWYGISERLIKMSRQ